MNLRLPDPPPLPSLSPADEQAFRKWAAELNRQITVIMRSLTAANGPPFWVVSVSTQPTRSFAVGATLAATQEAFGTLVKDLKAKGVVA